MQLGSDRAGGWTDGLPGLRSPSPIPAQPPPHPDSQAGAVGTAVPRDLITRLRFGSLQDQVLVFKIEGWQGVVRKRSWGEARRGRMTDRVRKRAQ